MSKFSEKDWKVLELTLKHHLWSIAEGNPKLMETIVKLLKDNENKPEVEDALKEYFDDFSNIKIIHKESINIKSVGELISKLIEGSSIDEEP